MNAHRRAESHHKPTSGLAQALYFKSRGNTLFGWLHRPASDNAANLGLVICNPFGYEATCSHRSIRAFAEAATELGIPTLRFDYLGTGDSEDIDPTADQLDVWSADVLAAVSELQRTTGVARICLMGIRLGGLLAALAGAQCPAVSAAILIAPVVNGPRYLRELRTTRLAARLKDFPDAPPDDPVDAVARADSDSIEISGFAMSAATVAAISQIDLLERTAQPAPRTLIIDGEALQTSRQWAQTLPADQGRTKYLVLPGLIEMIMRSPLRAAVPWAMVSAMREWLGPMLNESPGIERGGAPERHYAAPDSANMTLKLPAGTAAEHSSITERPVFIASPAMLFGIVTEPRQDERRRRGVILLNTGADYHIGANRMHVSFARRWARLGYVVLRLDLGGLGDSSTRDECDDDEVFPPAALEEIRLAIDFLQTRYGVNDMTIGGICSGAYHALRAAVAKLPINQILMINPQNFFWKKGMRIDELQLAEVVRNPATYLRRLFSRDAWGKLLAGKVSLVKVARVYAERSVLAVDSTVRELARRMRIRLPHDLGLELEEIAELGVRIVFVFARGEAGISLLKLQGGSSIKRLREQCRIHIINGGDHIFSQRIHRATMEDVLTSELLVRSSPRGVSSLEPVQKQS
jgi:alpha-beta hydrolase superfamily lysophospholipase